MKSIAYCTILMSFILTSGCVNRTVTESKGNRGQDGTSGSNLNNKVIEQKTIWFWQDDFRHP